MAELLDNTFIDMKEAEVLTIPTKTILLEEGKVADRVYFIRKGCLRLFFYNEGKDITFQFFFENDFVASFDSLYKDSPSLFSLESIEPSEILSIRKKDFYNKIECFPSLRRLYEEKIIERFIFYQHLFLLRIKNTPKERYEELLKEYPDIIQIVLLGVSGPNSSIGLWHYRTGLVMAIVGAAHIIKRLPAFRKY